MSPAAADPSPNAHKTRAGWVQWGSNRLRANPAAATRDAESLLAHALQIDRAQMIADPAEPVLDAVSARFAALIERRAAGEPLAYLTGQKEFWSLPLAVSSAVLVPRPETELLVERALALCNAAEARVLDLGTGSGAVALAIARERPRWHILAIDQSEAAIEVARMNAQNLRIANVTFACGYWFAAVPAATHFTLIVSNPPYLAASDPALQSDGVCYEPKAALVAGNDGLDAIRAIVAAAGNHLQPGGWLALEHGMAQGAAVRELLVAQGFDHVRSHFDLAGRERVSEGSRA
jgi:release factor glutamine methyltransferase